MVVHIEEVCFVHMHILWLNTLFLHVNILSQFEVSNLDSYDMTIGSSFSENSCNKIDETPTGLASQ